MPLKQYQSWGYRNPYPYMPTSSFPHYELFGMPHKTNQNQAALLPPELKPSISNGLPEASDTRNPLSHVQIEMYLIQGWPRHQ